MPSDSGRSVYPAASIPMDSGLPTLHLRGQSEETGPLSQTRLEGNLFECGTRFSPVKRTVLFRLHRRTRGTPESRSAIYRRDANTASRDMPAARVILPPLDCTRFATTPRPVSGSRSLQPARRMCRAGPAPQATIRASHVLFTALAHGPLRKCLSARPKKGVEKGLQRENETGVLPPTRVTTGESIRAAAQPCRQISGEVAG
jgi:hypothetical protein